MQIIFLRSLPGFAFSPHDERHREFADAFGFEPTPDQRASAEAVREAMERPRPMDWLLCGDVCYGKTEVAMRAVFKAAADGKQVALIAPTTLLAEQHFANFSDRFAPWPVRIAELSRFPGAIESRVCVTAQHREMLDQVLGLFGLAPDIDLDLMQEHQTLAQIGSRVRSALEPVLEADKPEMKGAVSEYPEFNLFSKSYVLSRLPTDDPKFEGDVVGSLFDLMDQCYGQADDWEERRQTLGRALETIGDPASPKRVCLPSPKALHNVEGFFLHLGDVLTKVGRIEDAKEAYSLAKLSPEYETWPHRSVLDERIATVAERSPALRIAKNGEGMMIVSALPCSGCHQRW